MSNLIIVDGINVRRDMAGRYCLNDLHRAAGGEERHKPSNFMRMESAQALCSEINRCSDMSIASVNTIRGGTEQGTYVAREVVYAYAMWISPLFNLKVIRTFDAVAGTQQAVQLADKVQAGAILLESMAKTLNLSNSSKLGGYQKLQKMAGLPDLAPSYAIDAPAGAVDGSSRPTTSLTTLLKNHNAALSATRAYKRLAELGIVEQKARPGPKGTQKLFWSVTSKGLLYGKNITSPANPRETQPHFFESKSAELLALMMTPAVA
ncbi:KilA-N domain-containing protein [Morganella morganii]|uniref:KilA-N domain-containing protein n=1 Tax=Morganella morganii TaxID=582 RepID=UPI000BBD1787|nr:KilA-N domain-containing protein [Morganella morganii]ATF53146.1 DNA-binding protein [Morganella morganii]EKW8500604.1 KilA-N domain-containing protein [Morganella morganii]MBT0486437.1 KilA-N domain-containing protein [Morganella morganii subsp. morganii]MDN3814119.1 KilA-N domain-containing protein [Morganella morganii]HDU8699811.1 KilA-N domain-containing protein [Morganella morganii subsp. morganii]